MELFFSTFGELKTIPEIKSGKILKIIGENGIGKSMAAIFFEIATGGYQFNSENQFNEIKNRFNECVIEVKTEKNNIKLYLTPGTWRYNKRDFKILESSIGRFELNGDKIDIIKLKELLSVKVIRGDENLETQLILISDIFIEYLDIYSNKIKIYVETLKNYLENFKERTNDELIKNYFEKQEKFNQLNQNKHKIEEEFQKLLKKVQSNETKQKLIEHILIWEENDPKDLKSRIDKNNEEISIYEENHKNAIIELDDIEKKIKNIEREKRTQIQDYFSKKNKNQNDKNQLLSLIKRKYPEEVREIEKSTTIELIVDLEESRLANLEKLRKNLEESTKGSMKINQILLTKFTQIFNILNECIADGFGNEMIIDGFLGSDLMQITIDELSKFVGERVSILEKSPQHRKLIKKYEELGIRVKEIKELLNFIKKWKKLIKLDKELKNIKKNIYSNILDQILEPAKVKNYIDKHESLSVNKGQIELKLDDLKHENENLSIRLELTENLDDMDKLIVELNKFYPEVPPDLNSELESLNDELKQVRKEYDVTDFNLKSINNNLANLMYEIEKIQREILIIAKAFNYKNFADWVEFVSKHIQRTEKIINYYLIAFRDYISILRNNIIKIEKNQNITNKKYLKFIKDIYDKFFLKTYNNPSFFKYVFKGYKKIKKFDVIKKDIIFLKEDGQEDHRSLMDFSAGEKAYAFIRAMITLFNKESKFKILFIDEANALMDYIRSGDLLEFQYELVENGIIDKIINILPIQEKPEDLQKEYQEELNKKQYYQEIIKE